MSQDPIIPYRSATASEPHRTRRQRLLAEHPEIRQLFGHDDAPKYRMAAVLVAQLAFAALVQRLPVCCGGRFLLVLTVAYLVGSIANHYGGVVIHEASHHLCGRGAVKNRCIAIFANLPKVLPYAMTFWRYHHVHHRRLGVLGQDNDLPTRFERRFVGGGAVRKLLWLFFYPIFGSLCRGFMHLPDRWEWTGLVVQLGFNVAVYRFLGPWALVYLAASTWFSASLHPIAGHFIHEHYLWDESERQETYSYYGVLNHVTLNMGLHNEHHDFPAVPGRDLPRLHAIGRAHYGPLISHTSWAGIFREFITNRRLSHSSRLVRS